MISTSSTPPRQSGISLVLNPTADSFQISGFEGVASLIISDLNCFTWIKKQVTGDENISLDTLKKGVYIAKIITPTETVERKLVKK